MKNTLGEKAWVKGIIRSRLGVPARKILFTEHHQTHAAAAFLPAPTREAATLTAESEVCNDHAAPRTFSYEVVLTELDGRVVKQFAGTTTMLAPGETRVVKASALPCCKKAELVNVS